ASRSTSKEISLALVASKGSIRTTRALRLWLSASEHPRLLRRYRRLVLHTQYIAGGLSSCEDKLIDRRIALVHIVIHGTKNQRTKSFELSKIEIIRIAEKLGVLARKQQDTHHHPDGENVARH